MKSLINKHDVSIISIGNGTASKESEMFVADLISNINKNIEQDIKTEIVLNNFIPDGMARTYTLWGNQIDSTNEHPPHNNVRIHENKLIINSNTFNISLRKHSLTAIEIKGKCE